MNTRLHTTRLLDYTIERYFLTGTRPVYYLDGMHELPITESILKIVLKHAEMNGVRRVVTIHLQIGKLSDLEDDWIQRYFDYLSKDTLAEGAKLKIERMPIIMQCLACSNSYEAEMERMGDWVCPECGQKGGTLLSGREYTIKEMEVQ